MQVRAVHFSAELLLSLSVFSNLFTVAGVTLIFWSFIIASESTIMDNDNPWECGSSVAGFNHIVLVNCNCLMMVESMEPWATGVPFTSQFLVLLRIRWFLHSNSHKCVSVNRGEVVDMNLPSSLGNNPTSYVFFVEHRFFTNWQGHSTDSNRKL